MAASVSFVFGIVVAAILLAVTRRREAQAGEPALRPAALSWWTLSLGLIAGVAFALAAVLTPTGNSPAFLLWNISIAAGVATAAAGIGAILRRDRRWPTWVGLAAGLAVAAFWFVFAAGNLLGFGE
ncbi:MAG: hypothetical protein JXB85_12645 [Anaerolineales bacterium]|nr:hypothetical protein [Anaerolineales bacterium]